MNNNVTPPPDLGGRDQGTVNDFILSTYSPKVAFFSTPSANDIATRNHLSLVQLFAPFCQVHTSVAWHEPLSAQLITVKDLRISPVDVSSKKAGLDSVASRKMLQDLVSRNVPEIHEEELQTEVQSTSGSPFVKKNVKPSVPERVPWFTSWKEQFIKSLSESEPQQSTQTSDFLNHNVACILVMSSSDGQTAEQITETVAKLSRVQQQHQTTWPNNWAFPSVLKFYLILHEKSSIESERAEQMYQNLRTTYGRNLCFMVELSGLPCDISKGTFSSLWSRTNHTDFPSTNASVVAITPSDYSESVDPLVSQSFEHPLNNPDEVETNGSSSSYYQNGSVPSVVSHREPEAPDFAPGERFSIEDVENLQNSISEFVSKALLPYVERQSRLLHESIVNKRGMSKSIFSATKRLFGTTTKGLSSIVYTNESLEMMSRKLADTYFLFGHYSGSYQLYHQLKKDFLGDSAWVHYSSSLEMAALSHFMMSQMEPPLALPRAFPLHYINDAVTCYLDNCRMPDLAMKCALIGCECLKQLENYADAAAIYIRMTSEDCDLKSALMLEQAATSFLNMNCIRKYALHSVLAGHRYSKAGLRLHSLKCYLQANQIYTNKGWRFAEDHVHFTIARHKGSVGLMTGISKYLQYPLVTPTPQTDTQIQMFFKEFITVMSKFEPSEPQEFFVPKVLCSDILVKVGEVCDTELNGDSDSSWANSLEEQIVKDNSVIHFGTTFKPSRTFYNNVTDNTLHPTAPLYEMFYVEIPLLNTLPISLMLRNIRLDFYGHGLVKSTFIEELELPAAESKTVRFELEGVRIGHVSFDWLHYSLEHAGVLVPFKQKISLHGPRLNQTKKQRCGRHYDKDMRNRINIVESMPLLQMQTTSLPSSLFHNQIVECDVTLQNIAIDQEKSVIQDLAIGMQNMKSYFEVKKVPDVKILTVSNSYTRFVTPFKSGVTNIPCIIRSPSVGEHLPVNMLILYSFKSSETHRVHHRVIQKSFKISLQSCLKLEYSPLKLVTASSFLGLVRVNNLTPEHCIWIKKMLFNNPSFKFELIVGDSLSSSNSSIVLSSDSSTLELSGRLEPLESRNIILKTISSEQLSYDTNNSTNSLLVHWELGASAVGMTVVDVDLLALIPPPSSPSELDDNSFIFELNHQPQFHHDFVEKPCFFCEIELTVNPRILGSFIFKIEKTLSELIGVGTKASREEVTFLGSTSWILDMQEPPPSISIHKLKYTIALTEPGIYNVAPTIGVSSTVGEVTTRHRKYPLHSPLIVSQLIQSN